MTTVSNIIMLLTNDDVTADQALEISVASGDGVPRIGQLSQVFYIWVLVGGEVETRPDRLILQVQPLVMLDILNEDTKIKI